MSARPPRSAAWLAAGVGLAAPALLGHGTIAFRDGDLPLHVRYGAEILARGGMPETDPVLAPATRFVDHEWLADLALSLLWSGVGLSGITFAFQLLFAAALAGATALVARAGAGPVVQLTTLVLLFATGWSHLATRPHVISWVGLVAASWAWQRWACDPRRLRSAMLGAAAAGALWVNLHAGALLVPLLLASLLIRDRLEQPQPPDRRKALAGACVIAVFTASLLCNPWGIGLLHHVLGFLASDVVRATADFIPPDPFSTVAGAAMLYLCCWAAALSVLGRTHRVTALWLVLWLAWGWTAARNVAMAGFIVAPVLGAFGARAATRVGPGWARADRLAAKLLAPGPGWLVLGLLLGGAPHLWAPLRAAPPQVARNAIAALPGHGGPLMAELDDAAWTALLRPDVALYFHPLTANFADADQRFVVWRTLQNAAPGWQAQLARAGIRSALLPAGHPLVRPLLNAGWTARAHADGRVVLVAVAP